jgi:hypothetical protein
VAKKARTLCKRNNIMMISTYVIIFF